MHMPMHGNVRTIATRILAVSVMLALAALIPALTPVFAGEGWIEMKNGDVMCAGISYYNGDRYRIVGRCQGLVYPYSATQPEYYLWVNPSAGGPSQRLDQIEEGQFDAQTDTDPGSVFITAESESTPDVPGTPLMTDSVDPFGFTAGSSAMVTPPVVTVITTPSPTGGPAPAAAAPAINVRPFWWPFGWVGSSVIGVIVLLVLGIVFFSRLR